MRFSLRLTRRAWHRSVAAVTAFLLIQISGGAAAQAQQQLLSPSAASELGLTEAWQRQLVVPAGSGSIVDQKLFVDRTNLQKFVEVVRETESPEGDKPAVEVLTRMRVGQLDRRGNPIDQAEAERLARNEIRKFERSGILAKTSIRETPSIRLYTLSDDGTIDCRDAETGRALWINRAGNRGLGYIGFGVDETYLSVLNGSNVLILDAASGDLLHQRPTEHAPKLGCVHVGNYTLVPTLAGGIEGYSLDDPYEDFFYQSVAGAALSVPTKAPDSAQCAWTTEEGFVYVMEVEGQPGILFRFDTRSVVNARVAAAEGRRYFFASEAGVVFALRGTYTGEILWSRPFGVPFYDSPTLIGDHLLVRSTYGNLYSMNISGEGGGLSGGGDWERPAQGIQSVLAANDNRVYASTLSGHLAVLDLESGKRVADFRQIRPNRVLVNRWSDRLYLINDRGTVQCLRPKNEPLPNLRTPTALEAEPETDDQQQKKPVPGEAKEKDEKDPFGEDPFGAPGNAADPFATPAGEDPFGTGDPFGGANDPFAPSGGDN